MSNKKTFIFEIPSRCTEVVEVEAESLEEAMKIIVEGREYKSHIPESEFNIQMSEEYLEELEDCYTGE